MATFTFFRSFKNLIGDASSVSGGSGNFDFNSDTFRWVLTNDAPSVTGWTALSDVTNQLSGNGYPAGGATAGSPSWTLDGTGYVFSAADTVFTSTGSMGPFRYAVLYDDTLTTPADPLIGYLDNGSSITVTSGNTFTIDVGANGIFKLD
jgi:hypothetical protein